MLVLRILQEEEQFIPEEAMQFFSTMANSIGPRDTITYAEFDEAIKDTSNTEVQDFLKKHKDTRLGVLVNSDMLSRLKQLPTSWSGKKERTDNGVSIAVLISKFFDESSDNNPGVLDANKWMVFISKIIEDDLHYLIRESLIDQQCYRGLGLDAEGRSFNSQEVNSVSTNWWSCEWMWRKEFWADYWYYERNNNGLLAVYLCDDDHPLTGFQRLSIEFCVLSWVLFMSAILFENDDGNSIVSYIVESIFVTIPVFVLRQIMFVFYVCPCLNTRHREGFCKSCFLSSFDFSGQFFGVLLSCGFILFFVFGVIFAVRAGSGFLGNFAFNWAAAYVYDCLKDFFMCFNPLIIAKSIVEWKCVGRGLKLLGFASWQLEQSLVQEKIQEVKRQYDQHKKSISIDISRDGKAIELSLKRDLEANDEI